MPGRIILTILVWLFWIRAYAQALRVPRASPGIGCQAYKKEPDIFSAAENVAALARIEPGIGIYSERNYFLSPLQLFSAFAASHAFGGGAGIFLNHFGYKNFQEVEAGLAYAKNLGPKLSIGAKFNYYSLRIRGYVSKGTPNAELGILFFPTSRFAAGFDIYNPVGGHLSNNADDKLASLIRLGMGYVFNPFFFLSLSVQKIEKQPVAGLLSLHYVLNKYLFLQAGFQTTTSMLWMAGGCWLKKFRLDLRVSRHPMLGYSTAVALLYSFKKEIAAPVNEVPE